MLSSIVSQSDPSLLPPDGPDSATVSGDEAVEVNDPVLLTCSAPSLPLANFSWTFNGSVMANVAVPVLTINKAVYKNSGVYECKASNTVTGKSATARHVLAVKGKTHTSRVHMGWES